MKIGVIVNVEKGMIQVRNCLGVAMEVLPLNVVNMLQMVGEPEEACLNKFNNISLEHLHEERAKAWTSRAPGSKNCRDDSLFEKNMNESEDEAYDNHGMNQVLDGETPM
jgi:hypothetical protein